MTLVGIDEVGRGCWAGPVVAGAVMLPEDFNLEAEAGWQLDDSKKLNKTARELASSEIKKLALAIGLGWVSARETDELGLTEAVRLAMQRALDEINATYDSIIIDGSYNFLAANSKAQAVIKADGSIAAVSAASIIAKVARDAYMAEQALLYPGYGFESHVGYGTRQHIAALRTQGVCTLHRRSYKPVQAYL